MNSTVVAFPRRRDRRPRLERQMDRFDRMLEGLSDAIPATMQASLDEMFERSLFRALHRVIDRVLRESAPPEHNSFQG